MKFIIDTDTMLVQSLDFDRAGVVCELRDRVETMLSRSASGEVDVLRQSQLRSIWLEVQLDESKL